MKKVECPYCHKPIEVDVRTEVLITPAEGYTPLDLSELLHCSVREALILIAKSNKNTLICKDAIPILLRSGRFESRDEVRGSIYPVLSRAREFRKIAHGCYALEGGNQ